MDVGIKIKAFIDERGITQIKLSAETGIPPSKLNLSLSGKRRLTFSEYQIICWVLGVGVDQFMAPKPPEGVSA